MNKQQNIIWKQLEARWDKGFEQLLPQEQEAIALWWLEAETMNGGLDQFFHNSAGDMALLALAGLKRLNCMATYSVLNDIMILVFGDNYPVEREQRFPYLAEIEAKLGPDYDRLATNFIQDLSEDFVSLAIENLEKLYANKM
jgi:Domain of unknown function (DUF4375)